jgi:predicted membrane GTPase involved in stress response
LLLVDAAEGPLPQTRFVLEHALALNHRDPYHRCSLNP